MTTRSGTSSLGFSLVEVVLAIGIVSFSVLATIGLLSVANETNKKSRDEAFSAQLAANEFERIRSLGAGNFPTTVYVTRYFDSELKDLGTTATPSAVYALAIDIVSLTAPAPADLLFNAEVRYPASAPAPTVLRFTTLMNIPK